MSVFCVFMGFLAAWGWKPLTHYYLPMKESECYLGCQVPRSIGSFVVDGRARGLGSRTSPRP